MPPRMGAAQGGTQPERLRYGGGRRSSLRGYRRSPRTWRREKYGGGPKSSFRGYRLGDLGAQCGFQGMPRQGGALDARRVIAHAAEDDQLAQVLADGGVGGQQLVELLQQLERFLAGFTLEALGHQGGRSRGDGAAGANEADVHDDVVFHFDEQLQLVAAERIVAIGLAGGVRHGMAVPRTLAVIENDFLVEIVDH